MEESWRSNRACKTNLPLDDPEKSELIPSLPSSRQWTTSRIRSALSRREGKVKIRYEFVYENSPALQSLTRFPDFLLSCYRAISTTFVCTDTNFAPPNYITTNEA